MQNLSGHFTIGGTAALYLVGLMLIGLTLSSFAPYDWGPVRVAGQLLMAFCAGMLASQHARIWVREPRREDGE